MFEVTWSGLGALYQLISNKELVDVNRLNFCSSGSLSSEGVNYLVLSLVQNY